MARVTDLNFYFEDALVKKLDILIKRVTKTKPKKDAVLLNEGAEGEGKSYLSFLEAYYISYKTGRPFSEKNVFFSAGELVEFAKNTEGQIIIYDEPALDSLAVDWFKKEQKDLTKLFMLVRKKRHFFILNLTKFYKFNEYIVVDRGLGMVHVYSRDEIEPGHFVYIKRKQIEYLYNDYRRTRKRQYKRYTAFRGTFPNLEDIPGHEKIINLKEYDEKKDKAIMSIGADEESEASKTQIKLYKLKYTLYNAYKELGLTQEVFSKAIKVKQNTLSHWKEYKKYADA